MSQERASWQVKDTTMLADLTTLMRISPAETSLLNDLADTARSVAPRLTKLFYDRLFAYDYTAEYLHNVNISRLHTMVADWFIELFQEPHDEAYVRRRMAIGQMHVRIGLPVRYPLAMLDLVIEFGEDVTQHSPHPADSLRAFRKALALDIAIFNQAYEHAQLHHLTELVGHEQLARRLLTAEYE
jgi:hypothetical protein